MKFIIKTVIMSLLLCISMSILGECSSVEDNSNKEVEILVKELSNESVAYAEKYFQKQLKISDFDLEIGEEVSKGNFNTLGDVKTDSTIYLTGHIKDTPKDIMNFVLLYEKGKTISFGLETLETDMEYIDIN